MVPYKEKIFSEFDLFLRSFQAAIFLVNCFAGFRNGLLKALILTRIYKDSW